MMFPRRAIRYTAKKGMPIQIPMSSSPGIPIRKKEEEWNCVVLVGSISAGTGYSHVSYRSFLSSHERP
jgi:hypothetical protein